MHSWAGHGEQDHDNQAQQRAAQDVPHHGIGSHYLLDWLRTTRRKWRSVSEYAPSVWLFSGDHTFSRTTAPFPIYMEHKNLNEGKYKRL